VYMIMNSTCPTMFDDNGPNVLFPIKVLFLHTRYSAACCQSPTEKVLWKHGFTTGLQVAVKGARHVLALQASPLHKGNMYAFWKKSQDRAK